MSQLWMKSKEKLSLSAYCLVAAVSASSRKLRKRSFLINRCVVVRPACQVKDSPTSEDCRSYTILVAGSTFFSCSVSGDH